MNAKDASSCRVLVTGGHGFVGRYVVAELARRHPSWTIDAPGGGAEIHGRRLDVADETAVERWLTDRRPDIVIHLAAVSAVTASVLDPRLAWRVNLGGALNLVLGMERVAPKARLLLVSSAEVYGASLNQGLPVNEDALLQPVNPYAASKAAADLLVRQAAWNGISAVIARPFNHTGAGQTEAFAVPSFATQIARIEQGLADPVISVGSLDDERDFLDVRDVTSAYLDLLSVEDAISPGEVFNVASGNAVRIGDILEYLLSKAASRIEVRVDPGRLRKASVPRVVGDASRLRARTGWQPKIALNECLDSVLDACRHKVALAAGGGRP